MDKLSSSELKEWIQETRVKSMESESEKVKRSQSYLLKLLSKKDFGLPTTCGYQLLSRDLSLENHDLLAFFSMVGLGLAMPLEDGVMHHFMGSMFTHNTSLPLLLRKSDGKITCSNSDDNFLILGWGTSGGSKEAAAARKATAIAAAGVRAAAMVAATTELAPEPAPGDSHISI